MTIMFKIHSEPLLSFDGENPEGSPSLSLPGSRCHILKKPYQSQPGRYRSRVRWDLLLQFFLCLKNMKRTAGAAIPQWWHPGSSESGSNVCCRADESNQTVSIAGNDRLKTGLFVVFFLVPVIPDLLVQTFGWKFLTAPPLVCGAPLI